MHEEASAITVNVGDEIILSREAVCAKGGDGWETPGYFARVLQMGRAEQGGEKMLRVQWRAPMQRRSMSNDMNAPVPLLCQQGHAWDEKSCKSRKACAPWCDWVPRAAVMATGLRYNRDGRLSLPSKKAVVRSVPTFSASTGERMRLSLVEGKVVAQDAL